MKFNFYLTLLAILVFSCNDKEAPENDTNGNFPFKTVYKLSELETAEIFESTPEIMGKVGLREASGLAFSRKNLGFVWTLQDRGNNNSIYLLDANTGKTVAEYTIKGTKNRDWEDIEISIGPEPGKTYLYIGDTGDNNLDYEDYTIYRIEEPKFEENHRNQTLELETAFDKIVFEYPDKSHDVEALLVDPKSGDIFMVTKRDLYSLLFTLPYPQKTDGLNNAVLTGTFPFRIATAGSVSGDGNEVLIKTYDLIFYWKRSSDQSFSDLLATKPLIAPYQKEEQGEAICFDDQGGYFTLSELTNDIIPDLNYYKKKNP
ncbi:hypothetical protein [Aquiflexum gelatinilyticum]|uniref:hypothetical protein n=1 Tax=Aquiflexum gelatinilyticum TaxID=2961943 RepID=UPI0021693FEE|nr:hypothetical protein [Aquiflexum gelatinilyticum]MCS4433291.1 hypothetical protein [Aquiflexum gelatinilyticum]